jgi:predicted RNase H-like nuclease (RuvC/YqgF family)
MRKTVVFVLAVISVLLLGAAVVSYSKYKKSMSDYAQLTAEEESTRQRYGQAISEIVTIQDSLNAIVLGEDAARLLPAQREAEVQTPGTLHDQVLSRIGVLKAAIERTKERITELDNRLKKSGVKVAGLERMVAGLKRSVAEKEQRIAELGTQVDTLQTRVAGLSTQVDDQQQEIAAKRREIATIFYAMGNKKELIRSGVVVGQGGVLGLGKTLKPSGQFDEAAFNALDTDQETVIRIPAEKVQVLSAQPATSYVIQPVGKDLVELHIVNPEEFRKVKHLVILTT